MSVLGRLGYITFPNFLTFSVNFEFERIDYYLITNREISRAGIVTDYNMYICGVYVMKHTQCIFMKTFLSSLPSWEPSITSRNQSLFGLFCHQQSKLSVYQNNSIFHKLGQNVRTYFPVISLSSNILCCVNKTVVNQSEIQNNSMYNCQCTINEILLYFGLIVK